MTIKNPSKYQLAVFEDVRNGVGHTVISAVAGSGKTSTIVEAMSHVPPGCKTLFVAFNKAIAEELKKRAPRGVEVSTLHSYGLKVITRAFGRLPIDSNKVDDLIVGMYSNGLLGVTPVLRKLARELQLKHEDELFTFDFRRDLAKVVSLAKGTLASDEAEVDALIDTFGIDLMKNVVEDEDDDVLREAFVKDVLKILIQCTEITEDGRIDFDDMIWLPVVLNLKQPKFDRVFVDETQDLNRAQIEMSLRAVAAGGRICAVGDPRQCIPAGQMVSTPRGPVPIERLKEGDEVLSVKAGATEPRKIVKKTHTPKTKAFEFDLGEYGTFQATAEHILFAAIDDPRGCFVYLMYRPDLGFRIGVSRTVGKRGLNFVVRTQQERAERLWVLRWFQTYAEAAELEAMWAYEFSIPREPFVPRPDAWGDGESTARLFEKFGSNGQRLLDVEGFDFDRPNYMAKATARGRVAVNLLLATKDGHKVEIESSIINRDDATSSGMLPTERGTMRLRKCFRTLREARATAESLAEKFCGYVVESLACTTANRRTFAVPAVSVNIGMLVPIVGEDGKVLSVPVLGRRIVDVVDCYDLEIEELGNFVVNGAVVHNCIYGFRGADQKSFDNLTDRLEAKVLPLSVCYRCCKAVVREAQSVVSGIEWAPEAEEGLVSEATEGVMVRDARPGDFILSRTNAPLVKLCMSFLKQGRKAAIQGRDIGGSLAAFVRRSKAKTVGALCSYVEDWRDSETKRLAAKRRDTQAVEDRAECILALADGASSVADVIGRIEELFADKDDQSRIVLSTTHKAKGLERERVWVLSSTYRRRPGAEEDNLYYVAVTRARKVLFLVEGDWKKKGDR